MSKIATNRHQIVDKEMTHLRDEEQITPTKAQGYPDKLLDKIVLNIGRGLNVSETARVCNISRTWVYKKLADAGISIDDILKAEGWKDGKKIRYSIIQRKLSESLSDDKIEEMNGSQIVKAIRDIEAITGEQSEQSEPPKPRIVINIDEIAINREPKIIALDRPEE
jgi:hypothetical protein